MRKYQKIKNKIKQLRNDIDNWTSKAIPPSELFTTMNSKYSQFDDRGIPTHDTKNKEISKKQTKIN